MSEPKRVQRKRTAGWKMPPNAIYVGRPTKWGNPYLRGVPDVDGPRTAERCVQLYRFTLPVHFGTYNDRTAVYTVDWSIVLADLRGKDLACWCRLCARHADGLPLGVSCPDCKPCHADHLLDLANR